VSTQRARPEREPFQQSLWLERPELFQPVPQQRAWQELIPKLQQQAQPQPAQSQPSPSPEQQESFQPGSPQPEQKLRWS